MDTRARSAPATVLVVDDEWIMRQMIGDVLADEGHRVVLAAGGEEALAVAAAEHPDVVLLDLVMPERSGLDILPLLRRSDPRCALIAVSGVQPDDCVSRALASARAEFLAKPFHLAGLTGAVERALARRETAASVA